MHNWLGVLERRRVRRSLVLSATGIDRRWPDRGRCRLAIERARRWCARRPIWPGRPGHAIVTSRERN